MKSYLGVVVVTRDPRATIEPVLRSIADQSEPAERVVVVDCNSADASWMAAWQRRPGFDCVRLDRNAGFTGGCNEGWRRLNARDGWVLFLNPDVIVPPALFARLRKLAAEERAANLAALSVRLLGWDFNAARPTGRVDSTGIFPCWHGCRDRRRDAPLAGDRIETVPALCGAFFFARVAALRDVGFPDGAVWDNRYFAYKEDIELSLRLRRAGGKLGLWHGAEAWHGRGWATDRRQMPRSARLLSARNEVRLHATYMPWRLPGSLIKWAAVRWLNL